MNISKILAILLLGAFMFTVGCESGSGSSEFLLSREAKVKYVSDSYIEDAILVVRDSYSNDIAIKADTAVFVQRSSQSGFSLGKASDIKPDAEIEYFYYKSNTDFSQSPAIYEIERIFVTNPE